MTEEERKRYLELIDRVNAEGKYHDDWQSIAARPVPAWYAEKRLGIFLHWGVFSVPAYHDWYARCMYIKDSEEYRHHLEHYGPHKGFGWKDFIPSFTMDKFDPAEWVRLFRAAGADYIVPVAEHHDGFQNYRSDLSPWNAYEMGPHRDIMGDLLHEAEKQGLTPGASSHRVEHWWFLGNGRDFDSDISGEYEKGHIYWPSRKEPGNQHDLFSTPAPDTEFLEDWLLRCAEICDRYHPRVMYFDWWVQHSAVRPYLRRFAAYYYNRSEAYGGGVICYKHDAMPFGTGIPDIERGSFSEAKPFLWQSDTSVMRTSWCHSERPGTQFKSAAEIVQTLSDIVSKNGRMLLNFGPVKDGTLCTEERQLLEKLAEWMKVNGEAIHGTGVWRIQQEGPTVHEEGQFSDGAAPGYTSRDFRFTCRGNSIYAVCMVCPENGRADITSLRVADASRMPLFNGIIGRVTVLGMGEAVWKADAEALHVYLGDFRSDMPVVIRVEIR